MEKQLRDYNDEVDLSPKSKSALITKLLTSNMPFPPFKFIDLNDLKKSDKLRL